MLFATVLSFRNSLLKIGRPFPKPVYITHVPNGSKLLTRLRLRFNQLIQQIFKHGFKDFVNPLCFFCLEVGFFCYFFPRCLFLTDIQKIIFNELQSVHENISNHFGNFEKYNISQCHNWLKICMVAFSKILTSK